jgi:hypothetical protein
MMTRVKTLAASAFMGATILLASATPTAAQFQPQDGLVNVAVGDVTIARDVNVGVAAEVAAQICGLEVGPIAVLGEAVDRIGDTRTICQSPQGPVTIRQN